MGLRSLLANIFKQKSPPERSGQTSVSNSAEVARETRVAHTFAEIEVGEERSSPSFSIPPRPAAQISVPNALERLRSLWSHSTPANVSVAPPPAVTGKASGRWVAMKKGDSDPYSFLYQARRRQDKVHHAVPHVPLQAYWTTYSNLDREQEQWYFYWRDQFRRGVPLPTDLSYIFLHVYEILHGVGFENETVAFVSLRRLHEHYRQQYPKLDHYLVDWLTDFTHYYKVDAAEVERWEREAGQYSQGDRLLQHWIKQGDFQQLPPSLFRALIAYRPDQNKFYREAPDKLALDAAFRRAIALTNDFYQHRQGVTVFEALRPAHPRVTTRQVFQGAVFEGEPQEYRSAEYYPYLEDGRLGTLLTQVVRHAENLARQKAGYKTLLRGIDLPQELADDLTVKLFPKAPMQRQVQIDPVKLQQLQRESAEIRERLVDEQATTDTEPTPTVVPVRPVEQSSPTAVRFTLPDVIPAGHLTDVEAIADVLDVLSPVAKTLLLQLRQAGFELQESQLDLPADTFASTIVDTVNEVSQTRLGDVLIVNEGDQLVVVEDYRDELEFLLDLVEKAPAASDTPSLSEPWRGFAESLTPVHLAVLERVISAPVSLNELDAFARNQGRIGSQLLEAINEKALDTLGDVLIDPYLDPLSVEETYRFDLLRLLQVLNSEEP